MGEAGDSGRLKRALLVNLDSPRHVIAQKYKRRKVAVVRDFPPGCGQKPAIVDHGSLPGAAAGTGGNYGGKMVVGDALEVAVTKTRGSEAECQSREKKHDSSEVVAKIESANEAVPVVCEALEVGATNLKENEIDVQLKETISDALENSHENNLIDLVDTKSAEVSKSSLLVPSLSNNMESGEGKAIILYENNEGEKLEPEFPMAPDVKNDKPELLGDSGRMEFLDTYKSMDGLESKDLLESDAPSEGMLPGSLKPRSPLSCPTLAANVAGIVTKKYPPRRRISVVRDFPPLCGPNVLRLSSSSGKKLGQEKYDIGKFSYLGTTSVNVKQSDGADQQTEGCVHSETNMEGSWDLTMKPQLGSTPKLSVQKEMNKKSAKPCQQVIMNKVGHIGASDGKLGKKFKNHTKEKSLTGKFSRVPGKQNQLQLEYPTSFELEHSLDKVVVQGLMAAPFCPWRRGKGAAIKHNSSSGTGGSQAKKHCLTEEEKSAATSKMKRIALQSSRKKSTMNKLPAKEKAAPQVTNQLVVKDMKGFSDHEDRLQDYRIVERSHNSEINMLPFGLSMSSGSSSGQDATGTRIKVRETLRLFQAICRKLLKEEEATGKKIYRRIDLEAGKILKENGRSVNADKKIVGHIPGVEVGDEFHYRMELFVVGVHRQIQGGIDFTKQGGKQIATSIVASGGYPDDLENSDTLIYSGQGGNVTGGDKDKQPEDQKLERGNLALKNSISEKNPVRVIRGFKETKASEFSDARGKMVTTYTYDGLYMVHKYWQEMGQHGKLVFQFQLHRVPGQPELAWKVVKKTSKLKVREGFCAADISQGKELMPICGVNTLDDEKPPQFTYITNMMYPSWYNPAPPMGCDCVGGCSDSKNCSCAVKNGGEIPYNHNGAIVEAKSLVYECGPLCRCSPSCHNRVTQHGIKFQLEVFKTGSRGWGVRSLNSIPSGSFICEYIGELLEDKEAEQRTGNDEYLFDIGHNYNDQSLWDGLSNLMPDAQSGACEGVEDGSFTIDAAKLGNVGRFINHSCSPNLYAQNVLYDYEDKRLPHIMFFAAENIPPLQELSYHYNYKIDEVRDSNGNIKKKSCYCGSSECTGRMY